MEYSKRSFATEVLTVCKSCGQDISQEILGGNVLGESGHLEDCIENQLEYLHHLYR